MIQRARRLWTQQAPRAGERFQERLVAWLDQQDRLAPPPGPIIEKVIDNAALLNTNISCVHKLAQLVLTGPNVAWQVAGIQHSGLGAGVASSASVMYLGGAVGSNSIELRFFTTLTVNAGNPITFWLYFYPLAEKLPQ